MPARILLVDDEPLVLQGWVKALKPSGHTVYTAETEAAAVGIAGAEPIDVVVVDYILGRITGVEVLNSIRKKRPLVRSILISGQIDEHLDEQSVRDLIKDKVEVDLYLHKPVRNKELRGAVNELLVNKEVDWKAWAQKVKAARDSKLEDATDAANRLNQRLKKRG
jgi:response regulator RpfG family c-di-GMP phosphodiesterase